MVERISQLDEVIDEFNIIFERLKADQPSKLRPLLENTKLESRGTLVIGPRGTGKTTFLLEKAKHDRLFYLSADSPLVANVSLWEIARAVFQRDFDGIIFDEVHFARNWSRDLKALYDEYPRKKIVASDSSSGFLQKGVADLSRRFVKVRIPLLSFRAYVFLKEGVQLPALDLLKPDLAMVRWAVEQGPLLQWFRQYLAEGLRPFFLEGNYQDRQLNIIEKTIY